MSHKSKVPAAIRKYFALRPTILGEDEEIYDEFERRLIAALEPRLIEEWLVAKDIIDTEWELQRQRRMKADIVTATIPHAFAEQLFQDDRVQAGICDVDSVDDKTEQLRTLVNGLKPVRPNSLVKLLALEGLTVSAVTAKAFAATVPTQQHLERMTTSAFKRRSAASAELQRLKQRQECIRSQGTKRRATSPQVNASAAPTVPGVADAHEPTIRVASMTSNARLAANRRNAAKSTGPRTFAGKVRSSRNAMEPQVWQRPLATISQYRARSKS